jgi:hypothetical protein
MDPLPSCPKCGKECPLNEFSCYGGHEDCEVEASVFMAKHLHDPVVIEGEVVDSRRMSKKDREASRKTPGIRVLSTSYGRKSKNRGRYDIGRYE